MFSPESKTTNKQMLDYLDRIVTDVKIKGESTGPKVRGKGIPYACLKQLMAGVGETIKQANESKKLKLRLWVHWHTGEPAPLEYGSAWCVPRVWLDTDRAARRSAVGD
jgi:hypothetical protein